jgi:hypothetical protein
MLILQAAQIKLPETYKTCSFLKYLSMLLQMTELIY